MASNVPFMKTQLRLMIVAAMLLVSIAASCQNQSIAGERLMQNAVSGQRDFDFLAGSWPHMQ